MNAVTLHALAAFPDQLEAHFAAFRADFTHWAPASRDGVPSEPLTATGQVCHVRDIEVDGYHVAAFGGNSTLRRSSDCAGHIFELL